MEHRPHKRARKTSRIESSAVPVLTDAELAHLGGGKVAYIRAMSPEEARERFPAIEGLPRGIDLFALHAADGTPIALTDSRQAAIGHAMDDKLEIAALH